MVSLLIFDSIVIHWYGKDVPFNAFSKITTSPVLKNKSLGHYGTHGLNPLYPLSLVIPKSAINTSAFFAINFVLFVLKKAGTSL